MTTFDKREEAFENLYAHDEEMHFKAMAHRNKDLAGWAAGLMEKTEDETAAYRTEIVGFGVQNGGDETLVNRICKDLEQAGHSVSPMRVRAELDRLMTEAVLHVKRA